MGDRFEDLLVKENADRLYKRVRVYVGIGNVFSSLIHSVARNPSLAKQLFGYAILGFALTEAIALFALMMAFLISSVFQSLTEGFCGLVPENARSKVGVMMISSISMILNFDPR